MRILKPQRTDAFWTCEKTCDRCGAHLEVARADLYNYQEWDIGGKRMQVLADCICCGFSLVIADHARSDWGDLPVKTTCNKDYSR